MTIQEEAQQKIDERQHQKLIDAMAENLREKHYLEDKLSKVNAVIKSIEDGNFKFSYTDEPCREGGMRYN